MSSPLDGNDHGRSPNGDRFDDDLSFDAKMAEDPDNQGAFTVVVSTHTERKSRKSTKDKAGNEFGSVGQKADEDYKPPAANLNKDDKNVALKFNDVYRTPLVPVMNIRGGGPGEGTRKSERSNVVGKEVDYNERTTAKGRGNRTGGHAGPGRKKKDKTQKLETIMTDDDNTQIDPSIKDSNEKNDNTNTEKPTKKFPIKITQVHRRSATSRDPMTALSALIRAIQITDPQFIMYGIDDKAISSPKSIPAAPSLFSKTIANYEDSPPNGSEKTVMICYFGSDQSLYDIRTSPKVTEVLEKYTLYLDNNPLEELKVARVGWAQGISPAHKFRDRLHQQLIDLLTLHMTPSQKQTYHERMGSSTLKLSLQPKPIPFGTGKNALKPKPSKSVARSGYFK